MQQERYMKSALVQQFRAFYEELITLKSVALEENSFWDTNSVPSGPLSALSSSEEIAGEKPSLVKKITDHLEKQLRAQYRLVEIQGGEYMARYYAEAQYIMVALADEIFLNLNWKGKGEWQDHLLESRLYGTQDAGDKFFNNLDTFLQQRDTSSLDLAVVYLMALGLGFQGKYRAEENASRILNRYRERLYEMINYESASSQGASTPIFTNAYVYTVGHREPPKMTDLRPWYWALATMTGAFALIAYMIWIVEVRDVRVILKNFNTWIKENAATFN